MNAAKFMEGLASGTSQYIEILNPAQLWYSAGRRPNFEEYFAKRPKDEILENHLEGNFAVMQRVAAQILLCGDTVHFAGGVPALFGSRQGGSSDRSILLSIGNLGDASGPRLPGAYPRLKEVALQEGHVFDLNHISREIALMESRGMTVDLTHTIESAGGIAPKNEALHLCAHTALTQLFGASSEISAAYRDLIPDTPRVDSSKLVPLQVCREIFIGALQRRWPENSGKRHVSSALASAAYALARVEMNAEVSFTPEEDEALASIV
ncbi:MAG: hypothetical protein Q7U75_09070 [Desulfobacterales bacterium]|nr:hypothetical protein [Desulfobacterales bacterium]